MHTKRIYLIVWTLLILIYKRGYCIDKHECLTWGINSNLLTLICRLNHLFEPVILIDNYEHEYIGCFFNEAINACLSRPKSHNITVDNSTNTVILTIDDVNKKNINGKWKCKQGKNIYETEVSISKGIISTTNLHISGVLLNTRTDSQVVMVTCYSCREPRKNNIEFLINGSSIDSIAYNKNTGHCTHKDGFCKPKDCFCDLSGNEFTRLFSVSSTNVTYFSCYTSFFDNDKKSIFSLNVTILFNDKVFHYIGSETKVLKPPSQNYDEDNRNKSASLNTTRIESSGTDSKRTEIPVILWIVAVVSIIIVLVPPVILSFLCVRNMIIQKKGHQHRPYVDTLSSQTGGSKIVKDDLQGHHNDTTHLLTDFEAIRDYLQRNNIDTASLLTVDSGTCVSEIDDRDFETSIETRDSGIGMGGRNICVQGLESSTASGLCEPCNAQDVKTSAMYVCLRCDEIMCKSCKINHSVMKNFRGHSILEIASLPEKFRLIQQCPIHEKYNDEYFCGHHHKLCCRKCIVTKHRTCEDVNTIEDVSEGFSKSGEFDLYKQNLQTVSDACKTLQIFVDTNAKQIVDDRERILQMIENRHDKSGENQNHLKQKIPYVEDQLEKQLQITLEAGFETLHKQSISISKIETLILRIERVFNWLSKNECVLETELFLVVQISKDCLNDIESDLRKIICESKTMKLQLANDKTHFPTYTQINLLQSAPPSYLKYLLSQQKMAKVKTENFQQVPCRIPFEYHE